MSPGPDTSSVSSVLRINFVGHKLSPVTEQKSQDWAKPAHPISMAPLQYQRGTMDANQRAQGTT